MNFAAPLVLFGLLVLLVPAGLYLTEQRRRVRVAAAFVSAPLTASVVSARPGLRRHVPVIVLALALALLVAAAAQPRRRVSVVVTGATVMLVNDVSDSMASMDVQPSRLAAAQKAAITFTRQIPATIAVGSIEFARHPSLLASPSTDHTIARAAIGQLRPSGGGTATGEAIETALAAIRTAPKVDGHRPPGAIVLLSDGGSNVGPSPVAVAAVAERAHVRIDTIAIGTDHGTIRGYEHGHLVTIPVPVDPTELRQTAAAAHGTFYRAPDQARARAIYARLAVELGHRRVYRSLVPIVAGAGLALILVAAGLSLRWFGRLA